MLALKFAHDGFFYLGEQTDERLSGQSSATLETTDAALQAGLYSFGLLETHFSDKAERVAKEGLSLTPEDSWSVHSVAHVHEMKAEVDKGLKFMTSTEKDWRVSLR
ncbi:tetratricopeptide repeat protein 38-like [Myxocyprinus asiaticus]|uniref:tetratricopeptide repeat protein 38-like n=1 Tax=Myxocyprinus asiaticus TaxID=70543 RepID=UPI00222259CD|nr:tetratricopeptide repeat protein 38-like [Myxocyprinus asiaticus]